MVDAWAAIEERILGGTTTRRGDAVFVRGEGCWLFDSADRRYLDLEELGCAVAPVSFAVALRAD